MVKSYIAREIRVWEGIGSTVMIKMKALNL